MTYFSIQFLGLWCELPIMVYQLPESKEKYHRSRKPKLIEWWLIYCLLEWKLPSILSASTQIAQLGPCIFLIGRHYAPKAFSFTNAIYVILGIGALSCFLLSFFWDATAFIFGDVHSVGLIVLNFSLAILGLDSSST